MAAADEGSAPVKISCRNIWKVYGPDPQQFFPNGGVPSDSVSAVSDQIQASGHIGAACNVSFDVHAGEIFVIMGLSGSGKSTMVRCVSRLVEPTAGEVLLDGEDLLRVSDRELIELRRHTMGMVFQNFGLLPHQTVIENVAFPLRVQGIALKERLSRAREVIDLVGLSGRETSFPRELSGGQQQRVGIARSLAVNPELWFLDEPFSALDPLIRRQMQDEFLRLQRVLNKTIVFITHDLLEALRLADRIAIMKDGWIEQIGTPADVIMRPATDYVAEFTQDVPRVRVLTVADILEPISHGLQTADGIGPESSLEALLPHFVGRKDGVAIADGDGKIIGSVTPHGVVSALAAGEPD